MALSYRKKLILAKIEVKSGTAIALAAADAILAKDVEITPLAGDTVSRDLETSFYGHSGDISVGTHQRLAFKVELASSGAAGTAPAWGKLLEGCGMAQAVTEPQEAQGVDPAVPGKVEYTPMSGAEKSLTLSLNIDGQLHTLAGARGSWKLELASNAIPYISFEYTGLWTAPKSAAAVKNPVYGPFKAPLVANAVNTPTLGFFGQADFVMTGLSYDHANNVIYRELIGASNEVVITDRSPTGQITVDAPKVSAINLVDKARSKETGALRLVHGTVSGSIIEISAPKVEITAASYQETDGAWQVQMPLAFVPDAGNDEFKLIAR